MRKAKSKEELFEVLMRDESPTLETFMREVAIYKAQKRRARMMGRLREEFELDRERRERREKAWELYADGEITREEYDREWLYIQQHIELKRLTLRNP